MNRIKVMVNGLPGNMTNAVAKHVIHDKRFDLIPQSLTGPEITQLSHVVESIPINLITPGNHKHAILEIIDREGPFISIDYTHPSAVNSNAEFYCQYDLPFVMGTTGGDRKRLEETVVTSSISAVIAPNMAKQIIGFQAMMEYAADCFPDLFKGYTLSIKESHQKGKADTSGTASVMVGCFNAMGVPFTVDDIKKERDPKVQNSEWGVPEKYSGGHAWHTYTLVSDDKTVKFEFTHNVNGRDVYAKGTLDAVEFLNQKVIKGVKGKVFRMMDVLAR